MTRQGADQYGQRSGDGAARRLLLRPDLFSDPADGLAAEVLTHAFQKR